MAVGSFSAGLSGLNANSTYLSVIGNNLANINTVGFKTSAVSFADLVSQTVGGTSINPMQVGLGVVTGSISPVFSQGSIENSREATNVAIQGAGFFAVARRHAQVGYTRAGNFSFDDDGVADHAGRLARAGLHADRSGDRQHHHRPAQPTDIIIPPGVLRAPTATTNVRAQVNLDAERRHRSGEPRVHDVDPDLRRARQPARADRRLQPHRRRRVDLHGRPCRRSTSRASPARRSR